MKMSEPLIYAIHEKDNDRVVLYFPTGLKVLQDGIDVYLYNELVSFVRRPLTVSVAIPFVPVRQGEEISAGRKVVNTFKNNNLWLLRIFGETILRKLHSTYPSTVKSALVAINQNPNLYEDGLDDLLFSED
jgi:hypothetical protein